MVRKAVLVSVKDTFIDTEYDPPCKIGRGIWSESVEKPGLTMSLVVIPPGGRNRRQYHVNCDAGMHILKGCLKVFIGSNLDWKEGLAEEGDFVFIPKGTIHGLMNGSDTEPAEIISCYGGVGHMKEAGTFYVEPAWEK
jgi:uncharacterized RmlC-like cupin family protein